MAAGRAAETRTRRAPVLMSTLSGNDRLRADRKGEDRDREREKWWRWLIMVAPLS